MRIIAGIYKNRALTCPKGGQTRPTSGLLRGAVFNICQMRMEGATFLDLFAGSGAMGIEALSRGASFATFIEADRESFKCIKKNIETLDIASQTSVLHGDVFRLIESLAKHQHRYSIIYADPPYDSKIKTPLGEMTYSSYIVHLVDQYALLEPGGLLLIEDSISSTPIQENLQNLRFKNSRGRGRSVLQQYEG